MNISLSKIRKKDQQAFKNIYQFYLYDLSSYTYDDTNDLLVFLDESTDLYLEEDQLLPFFINLDDRPIGFILVESGEFTPSFKIDYSISEFFILNKYRNKNYAIYALEKLFQDYPGNYILGQLSNNITAIKFWEKVFKHFQLEPIRYEEDMGEDYKFLIEEFTIKK